MTKLRSRPLQNKVSASTLRMKIAPSIVVGGAFDCLRVQLMFRPLIAAEAYILIETKNIFLPPLLYPIIKPAKRIHLHRIFPQKFSRKA